jgi:hypothetical protein
MITDPPYGIELDSEWRDRAGLNTAPGQKRTKAMRQTAKTNPQYPAEASYMKRRTEGHTETSISGDTREVLDGLLRIGFLHHQQLIWDKQRTVLTRTHYWFQHEPCWYVRKKNAPWFGETGQNLTIWTCPSPKFIMGGSDDGKVRSPDPEARRADAATPAKSHKARGVGLRAVPGIGNDCRRRGNHRARLLRH